MIVVKISDISELTAPQEQTKNPGESISSRIVSFLRDSVKNPDSTSLEKQE